MSNTIMFTPLCDNHEKECASVVCLKHRSLLCLTCIIDNIHPANKDCIRKEISRLQSQKEKVTVDILSAKLGVETRKKKIAENENSTEMEKCKIRNQVDEFYDKVVKKMEEMKNNTLLELNTNGIDAEEKTKCHREIIAKVEKLMSEKLDQLDESNTKDTRDAIEKSVTELHASPFDDFGNFTFNPTERLKLIIESEKSLGQINRNQGIYDSPDSQTDKDNPGWAGILSTNAKDELVTEVKSEAPVISPRGPTTNQSKERKDLFSGSDDSGHDQRDTNGSGESAPSPPPRADKQSKEEAVQLSKPSGIGNRLPVFIWGKKEQRSVSEKETEKDLYVAANFLDTFERKLLPIGEFSKTASIIGLSAVDDKLIAFIDTANDILFMADAEGNIIAKIACQMPMIVTTLDATKVAVLHGGGKPQLDVFEWKTQKLSRTKNLSKLVLDGKITGIDYNHLKKEFALSSEKRVRIVSENGNVKKIKEARSTGDSSAQLILTKYDFSTKRLYTVKITSEKKSVKCYSFKTRNYVWAITCPDDFTPSALVLDDNRLLVLCKSSIVEIGKDTGKITKLQIRLNLSGDALGMCIYKNQESKVAVISNDSDDTEKSLTMTFVPV